MNRRYIKRVQKALIAHGFDPGPVDGIMGDLTSSAICEFKQALGYRYRPFIGPLTDAALFEGRADTEFEGQPMPGEMAPVWIRLARSHIGLREYRGSRHNGQIVKWWGLIRAPFTDDETPWCAGFVGGCFEEAGIKSTRSPAARSYNKNWGQVIPEPCFGCVVVFYRGKKSGWSGHVGFVIGKDQHGNLMVLGGNQGNAVTIKPFDDERVLSYHYPVGYPTPEIGFHNLPIINSDGRVSSNEA